MRSHQQRSVIKITAVPPSWLFPKILLCIIPPLCNILSSLTCRFAPYHFKVYSCIHLRTQFLKRLFTFDWMLFLQWEYNWYWLLVKIWLWEKKCCLLAANINFIVFVLTRHGLKPTVYHTQASLLTITHPCGSGWQDENKDSHVLVFFCSVIFTKTV
jgi:hypothetical protein